MHDSDPCDGRLLSGSKLSQSYFTVCTPTKGYCVHVQFATLFSVWRYLVAFRRYLRSTRKVVWNCPDIFMLLSRQSFGDGPQISDWIL